MDLITWEEICKIAKPGDKLKGHFIQTDYISFTKKVNELTFWDCIGCLTEKEPVKEGAYFFLQKLEEGSFKEFKIDREPLFKCGEIVLYQNGFISELGEVRKVVENDNGYSYFVYYHTGDTAAKTDEYLLKKIKNLYAFNISRLHADSR